jgi:hypothetical protein
MDSGVETGQGYKWRLARAHLSNGAIKEYRHQIFEDVLTEMVIDLQEELAE